jgi:hypothetical protein
VTLCAKNDANRLSDSLFIKTHKIKNSSQLYRRKLFIYLHRCCGYRKWKNVFTLKAETPGIKAEKFIINCDVVICSFVKKVEITTKKHARACGMRTFGA